MARRKPPPQELIDADFADLDRRQDEGRSGCGIMGFGVLVCFGFILLWAAGDRLVALISWMIGN